MSFLHHIDYLGIKNHNIVIVSSAVDLLNELLG